MDAMVPLWVAVLVSAVSGVLAGVITPMVMSRLEQSRWRTQRSFDLRYCIFQEATRALAKYFTDCLDVQLQLNRPNYQGLKRDVEIRPETSELLEYSRAQVQSFFSEDTFRAYERAANADVRIERVPNVPFLNARADFFRLAASELGLLSKK